ncbi:MAG: AMP-dependent synthetase and ligase [Verrucomicrobiota bacterium]|jgi:amino acid adenylation domain-containing protein
MTEEVPSLDFGGPVAHPFVEMGEDVLGRSVHDIFSAVAVRLAGKVAIRAAAGVVTYGELLGRVDALAAALAASGERGDAVGLALPVGADIPAAMLACLAVGRPYVPLDLRHPEERKAAILRHAGCRTILVSGEDGLRGMDAGGAEEIDVRNVRAAPGGWRASAVPDDPAYVLYTSGSTGRPKGVRQDQRGLLHDVRQYTNSVHLSETDVCSLFYSPSVNGAIRDIYGALLNGAELCVTDLLGEGFSGALGRAGDAGMTVFHAMPPVLRSLLRGDGVAAAMRRVRLAYVAGDRFFGADVRLLRSAMPAGAFLYTGIGSTECATLYRQWFVPGDWEMGDGEVLPVGYAVPDRAVQLRDEAGDLVAPGERGEIHVRSRFVAQGYWREPELTAAAFRDLGDGVREFRTGDCGVLRSDGLLAFGGRGDRQVKVRGFRVEPGEVEAQLRAMDGIGEAAVVVSDDGRLVAFVERVGGGAAGVSGEVLRDRLVERLPGHLVPWQVVVLPALPRLANLKIDHGSLRQMAGAVERPGEGAVPGDAVPSVEGSDGWLAVVLAEWGRCVGRRARSASETWREAGGDSIQALALLVALEQKVGRTLPATTIGPEATPDSISHVLAGREAEAERPAARLAGTFWLVTWAPGASLHDRWLLDQLSDLLSGEVLELTTVEQELERIRTIPDLAEECAERIAERAAPGSDVYLIGISFGSRVTMELGSVLRRRGYRVRWVAVCDIAPVSGYDLLAREAEELKLRRLGDTSWWSRMRMRLLAEARWWMSRRVQWLVRRGWQRGLRWTAAIGTTVLGERFSDGVKNAIRRGQAGRWHPSWYSGELTLLLTDRTASLFPGSSATLGWEQFAQSVRRVTIPGDHFNYNGGEFAGGFLELVRKEVTRAAAQDSTPDGEP